MRNRLPLTAACAAALSLSAACSPAAPVTERLSLGAGSAQASAHSGSPALSADGFVAAFLSDAPDLVPGDTNGATDVFVRSLLGATTTRVSLATGGAQADGGCEDWDAPALSADGRLVAFASSATSLAAGVPEGTTQVYLRDASAGTTSCVSVDAAGAPGNGFASAPSISADGRVVAFLSTAALAPGAAAGTRNVFVRNMQTGTTTCVSVAADGSPADGDSGYAAVSADGWHVAFACAASNLVPGDTNEAADVFVRDLRTGVTALVSAAPDGTPGNDWSDFAPAISADGRLVAFLSNASNLVDGDTNGVPDVFLREVVTGITLRASVASDGTEANDASFPAALSGDGRYLAFSSNASNLAAGDTNGAADVFIRDAWLGRTTLASAAPGAAPADAWSGSFFPPSFRADGRAVAFESWAGNLVAGDTNATGDVFVCGPLSAVPPFTTANVATALGAVGGLSPLSGAQRTLLDVVTSGASSGVVDILDAARLARKAAGLD